MVYFPPDLDQWYSRYFCDFFFERTKNVFIKKTFSKTKIKKRHRRAAAEWKGTEWRKGDLFWSGAVGGLGSG